MRAAYSRRGKHMCDALNAMPGVSCMQPAGAFYCFPDVSGVFPKLGVQDSDAFASVLLERVHVAVVSGAAFGSPRHVRLSFATADAQIDEALQRLGNLFT
jgi:aspartate aminotransferase